jgi:5-deoxy-5-amino-3-dehydroquinate synthase
MHTNQVFQMSDDPRPVTPNELRRAVFKTAVRGYDVREVDEMLQRSAALVERLLGDPYVANSECDTVLRELRNADLNEVFRGANRDDVNQMCERAAATIDSLRTHTDRRQPRNPDTPADPIVEERRSSPLIGSAALVPSHDRESVRVALGARSYHVVIGDALTAEAVNVVRQHGARRVAIITQHSVAAVAQKYAEALGAANIATLTLAIADGESAKSLATVDTLSGQLAEWGLLRGDAIIAVGGGVVGDTAGFTASVYYRGVAVVQVPTTLLAMVDAAIGGKTATNLAQGKNLIGAFHQPIGVLCEPSVLSTLPDREYRCGLGEVLKYALMGDEVLLGIVANESDALLARDPSVLRRAIARSAAVKARFVSADEYERTGLREHLNYGHTLAHAIEIAAQHQYAHGEAVAIGLVFAGALAGALERISVQAAIQHKEFAQLLGLPTSVASDVTRAELIALMKRDKKAVGGLRFVLQGPQGLERVDDPPASALDIAFRSVGLTN